MNQLKKYQLVNSFLLFNNTFVKSAVSKMTKKEKIQHLLSVALGGAGGFVAGDYLGDEVDARGLNPFYEVSGGLVGLPLIMAVLGSVTGNNLYKSYKKSKR